MQKEKIKDCSVKLGKSKYKSTHLTDPVWHCVSARGAVVGVDDDDSDDDGGNDEDHGEEHVLPNEWYSAGSGGDQLHNDQQEHSQRQQDGDAESHFLTWESQTNHNQFSYLQNSYSIYSCCIQCVSFSKSGPD